MACTLVAKCWRRRRRSKDRGRAAAISYPQDPSLSSAPAARSPWSGSFWSRRRSRCAPGPQRGARPRTPPEALGHSACRGPEAARARPNAQRAARPARPATRFPRAREPPAPLWTCQGRHGGDGMDVSTTNEVSGAPAAPLSSSRCGITRRRNQTTPARATGWAVPTYSSRPASRASAGGTAWLGRAAAPKGKSRTAGTALGAASSFELRRALLPALRAATRDMRSLLETVSVSHERR